jgi:hypothetical protein
MVYLYFLEIMSFVNTVTSTVSSTFSGATGIGEEESKQPSQPPAKK